MYENPWWNPAAVRALAQRSHRGPEGHPVLARQCLLAHHGTPRTAQLRNRSDGDTIPASRAEPNRGAVANRGITRKKREENLVVCCYVPPFIDEDDAAVELVEGETVFDSDAMGACEQKENHKLK